MPNRRRVEQTGQRPDHPSAARSDTDRRRPDVVSLVTGTVLLGVAAGWTLTWTGILSYAGLGWYLPLLLIIAGLLGVLVSRRRP